MGQTLQSLTGGRFRLGLGRSAAWRWRQYGAPVPTLASLEDTADLLRRLWRGETVSYRRPGGRLPRAAARAAGRRRAPTAPPRRDRAQDTRGSPDARFDGVLLHPFLTPDGVRHSIAVVRDAAAAADRDPASLRCVAAVVVAPDRSPTDTALAVGARAAGYLQLRGLGDALAAANGWSADALARYRARPALAALGERSADKALPRDELVELSRTMPRRLAAVVVGGRRRTGLRAAPPRVRRRGRRRAPAARHHRGAPRRPRRCVRGLRRGSGRLTMDLDEMHAPLAAWIAEHLAAAEPTVSNVELGSLERPAGGRSHDTLLVDASWVADRTLHRARSGGPRATDDRRHLPPTRRGPRGACSRAWQRRRSPRRASCGSSPTPARSARRSS